MLSSSCLNQHLLLLFIVCKITEDRSKFTYLYVGIYGLRAIYTRSNLSLYAIFFVMEMLKSEQPGKAINSGIYGADPLTLQGAVFPHQVGGKTGMNR
jgi:hypothetical protein